MKTENFKISIEAARINAGLSQWQFANRLKVSAATVARWESGKGSPTVSQFRKISDLTGIPIDYIYLPGKDKAAAGVPGFRAMP